VIPEFRRKHYLNSVPRVARDVTVAIHIRRGDVRDSRSHLFTSNEHLLPKVAGVKSIRDSRRVPWRIDIYSMDREANLRISMRLGRKVASAPPRG